MTPIDVATRQGWVPSNHLPTGPLDNPRIPHNRPAKPSTNRPSKPDRRAQWRTHTKKAGQNPAGKCKQGITSQATLVENHDLSPFRACPSFVLGVICWWWLWWLSWRGLARLALAGAGPRHLAFAYCFLLLFHQTDHQQHDADANLHLSSHVSKDEICPTGTEHSVTSIMLRVQSLRVVAAVGGLSTSRARPCSNC